MFDLLQRYGASERPPFMRTARAGGAITGGDHPGDGAAPPP
jgi:hypothetical protein